MENFIFYEVLHLTLTFRTVKKLCPNLQKPPLPSDIPGYVPVLCIYVVDNSSFEALPLVVCHVCSVEAKKMGKIVHFICEKLGQERMKNMNNKLLVILASKKRQ